MKEESRSSQAALQEDGIKGSRLLRFRSRSELCVPKVDHRSLVKPGIWCLWDSCGDVSLRENVPNLFQNPLDGCFGSRRCITAACSLKAGLTEGLGHATDFGHMIYFRTRRSRRGRRRRWSS